MSSHAPQTIFLVTNEGSVATSGGSLRLSKGQFGIVDKGAPVTAAGMPVVTSFPTAPKDRLFELKLGVAPLGPTRSQSNKSYSSLPFKLSEVVDIRVNAPKIGSTQDELIIGYDGINVDTAITLSNGDNEVIDITLAGEAIAMLGYAHGKVTVKLYLEAPNGTAPFTNQEIIEKGIERLKNIKLVGNVPITDYIQINPVNSTNPVTITGKDQVFQTLVVPDKGTYSALGLIQAAYPNAVIKRQSYSGDASTYVAITDEGVTLANYTKTYSVQAGDECGLPDCSDLGTLTLSWVVGATCNAVGKNYKIQLKDDNCDGGNLEALQAAYPELSITVDTASATIQRSVTLSGTTGSASLVVNGNTYATPFNTDLATTAAAFAASHAAAILADTGATVTSAGAVIKFEGPSSTFPSITAVAGGLTETLGVVIADTDGTARTGGCQTVYRATVFSDLVCEECSPIYRDLFVTEAPAPFKMTSWVAEPKVYNGSALMGIRLVGKDQILAGTEEYRDELPFIYDPIRISVANEAPGMVNESFKVGSNGRFAVKLLSIASRPESLGGDFYDQEERTRVYYENHPRLHGNNYGKFVKGQESNLIPLAQYVDYAIRIRHTSFSQSFSGELVENIEYHILVDACKNLPVEGIINALATAAGLPTVQAYVPQT